MVAANCFIDSICAFFFAAAADSPEEPVSLPENASISACEQPSNFMRFTIVFIGIFSFCILRYLSYFVPLTSTLGAFFLAASSSLLPSSILTPVYSSISCALIPSIRIRFTMLTIGIPIFFILAYLANFPSSSESCFFSSSVFFLVSNISDGLALAANNAFSLALGSSPPASVVADDGGDGYPAFLSEPGGGGTPPGQATFDLPTWRAVMLSSKLSNTLA
mmetsp:Transcript_33314/g.53388  ORF Transcript_33314/g.53388 Transcript_33314/m.53388 type:complete len:220 (-) Transcript_33314:651-1310(-)